MVKESISFVTNKTVGIMLSLLLFEVISRLGYGMNFYGVHMFKSDGLKVPLLIELGVNFSVNMYRNIHLMDENEHSNNQSSKLNIESLKPNIGDINQTFKTLKMTKKQISNVITLYEQIGTVQCLGEEE